MKGTICGHRAMRLAALVGLAFVAAPAAYAGGTDVPLVATPAVPSASAPAVPAAPVATAAVPTPAVSAPAAPAPAATPTLQPAQTAGAAVVDTAKAAAATVVKTATTRVAKRASVKPMVKKAAAHTATAKLAAKAGVKKNGTITVTSSTTVDMRKLANTSSNPLMGCYGSYQLCQTIPDFTYPANNDCNNEQIPFVGQFTLWMQTSVNALTQTVTVHQRSFFVGFHGQGDHGNVYNGVDTQNDFQRTFGLTGGITVDHRDYEVLTVVKPNPADPAPNEFMYFHTITSVDPADPMHPQIAIMGPFVVCTCGATHSKDTNYGGKYNDDDSGEKHHHHEDYKGYNDDPNDWDD